MVRFPGGIRVSFFPPHIPDFIFAPIASPVSQPPFPISPLTPLEIGCNSIRIIAKIGPDPFLTAASFIRPGFNSFRPAELFDRDGFPLGSIS